MSPTARRAAVAAVAATIGLLIALGVAGHERALALFAYVLFAGALGSFALVRQTRASHPIAPDLLLPRRRRRPAESLPQLTFLERRLSVAQATSFELHHRLRPLAREVAAARLARHHGIDLDRQPERARAVLGDGRAWELVRPDREPPEDRLARGWRLGELRALIDELESI